MEIGTRREREKERDEERGRESGRERVRARLRAENPGDLTPTGGVLPRTDATVTNDTYTSKIYFTT